MKHRAIAVLLTLQAIGWALQMGDSVLYGIPAIVDLVAIDLLLAAARDQERFSEASRAWIRRQLRDAPLPVASPASAPAPTKPPRAAPDSGRSATPPPPPWRDEDFDREQDRYRPRPRR